ncbi:hypothetical protein C8J56DRAFT_892192 [Mycena floridula]|nr:hypothetical protein C8J56DRAFT_892192 [Mycena floridula]
MPLDEVDGGDLDEMGDADDHDKSWTKPISGKGTGKTATETVAACAHDTLPYNTNAHQNTILMPTSRGDVVGNEMLSKLICHPGFADSIGNTDECPKSEQLLKVSRMPESMSETQCHVRDVHKQI